MEVFENYSLKKYNTFSIDVNCSYFVESDKKEDFLEFIKMYELDPKKIVILGGGSDFLFIGDFKGTVLYPTIMGKEIILENEDYVDVRVGAGENWDDFVLWAVDRGYGGIENLSLIPGNVGAAPVQNVGAYGMEAADIIESLEAIDIIKGKETQISKSECEFSYRSSKFKGEWKNLYIITSVVFRLSKKPKFKLDYGKIRDEIASLGKSISLTTIREAVINIRESKLPDYKILPNAGSFFKNPIVDKLLADKLKQKYTDMPYYIMDEKNVKLAAGWMIESCGWKGKRVGNVGVYEKQSLVIINYGGASGMDIAKLSNDIKNSVLFKFGIMLYPEVYVI